MKTSLRTLPLAAAVVLAAVLSQSALASGGAAKLDTAPINLHDEASLQRGARNFVNYCLNCHNAAFMRFSSLTQIGLTEKQIAKKRRLIRHVKRK